MESAIKYKIKRHLWDCEYEKLWRILTVLAVISILLLIRGSNASLFWNNKLLVFLFCEDSTADKTVYNIAISYFAAYIFYIIQVYLPERKKTIRALNNTVLDALNFANHVYRFVFLWRQFANTTSDGCIVSIRQEPLFYTTKGGGVPKEYTSVANLDELKNIITRMKEDYQKVIDNPTFIFADDYLQMLFRQINIPQIMFQNVCLLIGADTASKTSATVFETYSESSLSDSIKTVDAIYQIYGFEDKPNFSETKDKNLIADYIKRQLEVKNFIEENHEFFSQLPDEYRESLK